MLLTALADAERDPDALGWFGSRDFRLVADWAGIDPDAASDLARRFTGIPAPELRTEKEIAR